MKQFDARKIVFALLCLLVFFSALVSGAIYPWYEDIFVFAASILFLLSLAGPLPPLAGLLPIALASAVAYLSSFWTVNLNNTLEQAFFFTGLMLFAVSAASSVSGERKYIVLKVLAAAAAIVSIYAIYQYFFGFAHTEEYIRQSGLSGPEAEAALKALGARRAFSTLMSPNILACYLASVVPVVLALLLKSKNKWVYGFVLVFMLIALSLTKSVGGALATASGTAVFLVLLFRLGRLKARTAAVLVLVLLLAAGAAVFAVRMRSGGAFSFGNSVTQRQDYYSVATRISGDSPILGRGAGSFQVLYPGLKAPGADESRYAHNVFLQYLAEEGLIGILAVAGIFAFFFYNCLKKIRKSPDDALLFAGVASGGAAFLAHNLVDFPWFIPETAAVFWLYLGLSASRDDGGKRAASAPARLAAAGLALIFLFFFSKSYIAETDLRDAVALLGDAGITSAQAAWSNPAPPGAVGLAEDAVRLKPYDDGLHDLLAGLYEGRAISDGPRFDAMAEAQYKEAIRLNPEYPFHYRDLGILYLKRGHAKRASEQFRKAISLYPASDSLKKYLSISENR